MDTSLVRLLILDDDPMIGATIKRIAEFDGYAVAYTENAEEFFERLDSWQPHIITLDLIMPDMSGVEVMERLVARQCGAALVLSSGVGDRVLDAAERSARENGLNVIGVLPKPFAAKTLREMLHGAAAAERAMAGPARGVLHYDPLPTTAELSAALDAGQISVAYQPKARCRSGTLAGFEALARWQHPTHGEIPPHVFIPLAESGSLVDRLTLQVAAQALRWLAELPGQMHENAWHDPILRRIQLSLNISARSLTNRALFEELAALCRESGIPTERVILELTETSAMEDAAVSLNTLTHLRLQGFSLSIDDFGTGYSSMIQLVRMPFSEIKVDKSFVMTAMTSAESRAVVRSVVDLGRSLGMETTAEGVEDEETLNYLNSLNCDIAQGYLLAAPLRANEIPSWYSARRDALEERRLAALHRLNLLDTAPEERFDRITRLAANAFSVDTAMISLVDRDRQWFKSRMNFHQESTPREVALCNRTIQQDSIMVIKDAARDPVFEDNPLVTANPPLRFYAGRPLFLDDGSKVGTLCLVHANPRNFSKEEKSLLNALADMVEEEFRGELQAHLHLLTGLPDTAAFRFYAERALRISEDYRLEVAMLGLELALNPSEVEDDTLETVRGRQQSLARFSAQYGQDAFLIGHFHGFSVGMIFLGRNLLPAQTLCHQLRDALASHNTEAGDDGHISAAVTVYNLHNFIGTLTH